MTVLKMYFIFYIYALSQVVFLYSFGHESSTVDNAVPLANKTGDNEDDTGVNNVLLISFDGFRWDYFDLVDTPALNSFKKDGVYAKYVINVIPTSTFPNHVTLATGLYPESHGLVKNSFYDPVLKDSFSMPNTDPKFWWNKEVEPIWYTNEKQGGVSGVCYWPGYNIKGYKPTYMADPQGKYIIPYHDVGNSMPYKDRVDNIIQWLQQDRPPNFLMLYFGELDEAAHRHGFASTQSLTEVTRLDNTTRYLLDELAKHKLLDKWNIIITGDHGMTNMSADKIIYVPDYIKQSDARVIGSAITHVWPTGTSTEELYKKLKNAHPNMTVYLKNDVPEHFHYRYNIRISPIVIILDEGWRLMNTPRPNQPHLRHPGSHGFSNTFPSMWPLFLARGPAFKKGYFSTPFNNVDIYPLMCKILGITPRPNNGSLDTANMLLLSGPHKKSEVTWSPIFIGVFASLSFVSFGVLVFAIAMCCSMKNGGKLRRNVYKTKVVTSELEQADKLLDDYDNDNEEVEYYDKNNDEQAI